MATALEIQIAKSKNNVLKMKIMMSNLSKSCDSLLHAHKNDHKIIHFLNWKSKLHDCLNNLIFHIGFELILKCSNIIDLLINNKNNNYTKNKIGNIEFFLCILFQNRLIMKKILNNESKWKPLMVFWGRIISHNKVHYKKYSSLLYLIGRSQSFWEMEHFLFVIENKWETILFKANYAGFSIKLSLYRPKFSEVTYILLHNIKRTLMFSDKSTKKSKQMWMLFQINLNYEADKITKKCKNNIKEENNDNNIHVNKLILMSWQKFIQDQIRLVPMMLESINPPRAIKMFMGPKNKTCTYYKCNTLKLYGCNIKMKVCKGCKLTYYCSRKCYKRDWNSKHRYECSQLSAKM